MQLVEEERGWLTNPLQGYCFHDRYTISTSSKKNTDLSNYASYCM